MEKAILISIRPRHVKNILNGIKTLEIRKKFPIDYVGWVYIYCTKDKKNCLFDFREDEYAPDKFGCGKADKWYRQHYKLLNGKVVARFWCDKVEEIKYDDGMWCHTDNSPQYYTEWGTDIEGWSCLTFEELHNYLQGKNGCAIHINDLEIFDKPKEISEFKSYKKFSEIDYMLPIPKKETCERLVALTRAPQSYQFIEI